MNRTDRGILYGMVFGDGNLHKTQGSVTYALTIGHGPKQIEYLEYKASLVHSIFGGKKPVVNSYNSLNKTMNKVYTNFQFRDTNNYYNQMHRNVYGTGSKRYTRKTLDYLTDQGLALWFMDDGSGVVCRNKRGNLCGCMIRISTYCSREDALIIQKWFQDKYNLSCVFDVDPRNNLYSIRFKTQDSKTFASIVEKYLLPSMRYKVDSILSYVPRVQGILPETSEG